MDIGNRLVLRPVSYVTLVVPYVILAHLYVLNVKPLVLLHITIIAKVAGQYAHLDTLPIQ